MKNCRSVRYCGITTNAIGIIKHTKNQFSRGIFSATEKFNSISQFVSNPKTSFVFHSFRRKVFSESVFSSLTPLNPRLLEKLRTNLFEKHTKTSRCAISNRLLMAKRKFYAPPFSSGESPKVRVENKAK